MEYEHAALFPHYFPSMHVLISPFSYYIYTIILVNSVFIVCIIMSMYF